MSEDIVRELQLGGGILAYGGGLVRISGKLSGETGQQLIENFFSCIGEMLERPHIQNHLQLCLASLDGPCHELLLGGCEALASSSGLLSEWDLLWSTAPNSSKLFYLVQRLNQEGDQLNFSQRPTSPEECGNCPARCFG
ncbi:MAG: hypothetical protein RRB13_15930 [bacterium]|nr:hypothetical protein [bacterium]